jgi:hypothetical protein
MQKKVWKPVKDYEDLYEVNQYGEIKSLKNQIILKAFFNKKTGYLYYNLYRNGKKKLARGHRVVGEAFLENPLCKPQINHKNLDRADNRLKNLEWCTNAENQLHAFRVGGKVTWNKGLKLVKRSKMKCRLCKKEFIQLRSKRRHRNKFCSPSCSSKFNGRNCSTLTKRKCFCGTTFRVCFHKLRKRFCSKRCVDLKRQKRKKLLTSHKPLQSLAELRGMEEKIVHPK